MARRARLRQATPLYLKKVGKNPTFQVIDSASVRVPAVEFIRGPLPRNPELTGLRLAEQFVKLNELQFAALGVTPSWVTSSGRSYLCLTAGIVAGAVPVKSPLSGTFEQGLVVTPRFGWQGLGLTLSETGWKRLPSILKMPLLPKSERAVPAWVIASVVLARIESMLTALPRRFAMAEADLRAPKGQIRWGEYIRNRLPNARFLDVPSRFPELDYDRKVYGAIHYVLRKQAAALASQRQAGRPALDLLGMCQRMLAAVQHVPPRRPSPSELDQWRRGALTGVQLSEGLEAIEWTVDERGLAGIAEFEGLPWRLSLDEFFEAWVETLATELATKIGGVVQSARTLGTRIPIAWDPPFIGSQRFLLPDVTLARDDVDIVFDAKYKEHWEELGTENWRNVEDMLRERHREDLLQVLAYAATSDKPRVVACLVYPCRAETWESMKQRGRLYHRASIPAGTRRLDVVLTAIPFGSRARLLADDLAPAFDR